MRLFIMALGGLIALAGALALLRPSLMVGVLNRVKLSSRAIYAAGTLRLVLGLLLVIGASATASPAAIRVLGVFAMIAGAWTLMSVARVRTVVDWFVMCSTATQRLFLSAGIAFGVFLAWAAFAG